MSPRAKIRALSVVFALVACTADTEGTADDAAPNEPCVPGKSRACECDDGSPGAQVCEPDGQGYPACTCAGADGGGETGEGGGTSAGTAGSATSASTTGAESAEGPGDGSTTVPADETGACGGPPTFSCDIVPIFYESCGADNVGCHSRNAYAATADQDCRGWLALEDEALGSQIYAPPEVAGTPTGCPNMGLYDRLMDLAPWQCDPSSQYVAAGSLESSYLFQKMSDGTLCGDFDPMPPENSGYEISQEQIDTIAAWIMAGALND